MITTDINKAIQVLQHKGVVAIPTETVYGLAANAFDDEAVQKIFTLKNRPTFNPLIVHLASATQLTTVATNIPATAYALANAFWPGPLTLVLQKQTNISSFVTASKQTIAVRVPQHGLTQQLLQQLDFPLAAPSANPFGSISPTTAQHVYHYFEERVPIILDGGECTAGVESTIIGFQHEQPVLYRHGAISMEALAAVVGDITMLPKHTTSIEAPGMLASHYAPKTPLVLMEDVAYGLSLYTHLKVGLLVFRQLPNLAHVCGEVLSKNGSLEEAAHHLYAAMHRLDAANYDVIIAERLPNYGVGITVNDRLERASYRS
ncbi:L-threonylcarbamoyladenylate synthase [Ferruginibacter yonginensis]|uniref:Threonylcarbamoyl-AMP synthase n=1 Tax=Ferruginibacter yonginensis TaxID=1310416 RepID=A0ABV8QTV4_9BACT